MHYTNLNGKLLPAGALTIASCNSALRYGFGLFETMLVQDAQIQLEEYHWARLWEGMSKLYFDVPKQLTSNFLKEEVMKCVKKNRLEKLCRIRLQIFTEMEGIFNQHKKPPQFFIECFTLETATITWNENGWVCGIAEDIAKPVDNFSNLKSCNMQPYVLAAQFAKHHKWNDAFVLNPKSHIIESTIANIFWVKNNSINTPPLSEGCIAGVMRKYVIEKSVEMNFPIREKPLTKQELLSADEVFLTNAIRRMKWVSNVHSKSYKNDLVQFLYNRIFHSSI